MLRKTLPTLSMRVLVAFTGSVAILITRVEGAALPVPPAINEDTGAALSIGTPFAASVGTAFLGGARGTRAEPDPSLGAAIDDNAIRYSQMEQTLASANTLFARGARKGGYGGGSAGHARSASSDGQMDSSFPGDLLGGNFAWPYFNYCRRHPGDQNC